MKVTHPRFCYGCKYDKELKEIGYDIKTMHTFCLDYHLCQAKNHPNHPEKVQERGSVKELLPISSSLRFQNELRELLGNAMFENTSKVLGKSIALRVAPDMAWHLLKVAQQQGHTSVNQTLNYIIEQHEKEHSLVNEALEEVNWETRKHNFHTAKKAAQAKPKEPMKEESKEEESEEFVL